MRVRGRERERERERERGERNSYVVDETVFGGGLLGLECAEESLLGTKDLDSGRSVLGKVDERAWRQREKRRTSLSQYTE